MSNQIFTQSKKMQQEYCCTILRIGEITPVPDSDFLAQTLVNGNNIVIRKDEVKTGDIMIYAPIETQLSKEFLGANNLFECSEGAREKNANYEEVKALLEQGNADEARKKCGFFNKHGRVRLIRLRKCPSFGFLFTKEALGIWKPELKDINLEPLVGTDFDTVLGELFVKVYVPFVPGSKNREPQIKRKDSVRFDRMVPGEFVKHYDTAPLQRNMDKTSSKDVINISVKLHGTSAIFGKLLCRVPKQIHTRCQWFNDIVNYLITLLPEKWQGIREEYQDVYSSRNVIKNQYIRIRKFWKKDYTKNLEHGFYGSDVWGDYNALIKDHIEDGMTVYGEIVGYCTGEDKMIQKEYDYGCARGENKLMIYRITTTQDGKKYDWNVSDVLEWTKKLIKENPELAPRIHPIDILYHGPFTELYPEIDPESEDWNTKVLEALKTEKRFGMEELEPLCTYHKVPREGIVLRIDNDPVQEAFKLKCVKFLEKEAKEVDAGNVDIEMAQGYESTEEEV